MSAKPGSVPRRRRAPGTLAQVQEAIRRQREIDGTVPTIRALREVIGGHQDHVKALRAQALAIGDAQARADPLAELERVRAERDSLAAALANARAREQKLLLRLRQLEPGAPAPEPSSPVGASADASTGAGTDLGFSLAARVSRLERHLGLSLSGDDPEAR